MSLQPGLSFDQAPPILVPFRFFLTAPWFGVLAAALFLWYGPALFDSRWLPEVLAVTHLITLGFLGMVMAGALMQMLPVVAGAPVQRPVLIARLVHGLLLPGILFLVVGFLTRAPWSMRIAMPLLAAGFGIFVAAVAVSLRRAKAGNPTASGMRLAVAALAVTAVLGLVLATNYGWGWWIGNRVRMTNLHLTWGLLGWIGLLVTGVAYQVVPMFQLTPSYPRLVTRWLARALFALLVMWSATLLLPDRLQGAAGFAGSLLVSAGYAVFAAATLLLQRQRRRRQSDVTLLLWRFAMICLALSLAAWVAGLFLPELTGRPAYAFLLGFLMIAGFSVGVVNGMLYKIVPFLIWFHLQSQLMGIAKVPNMKEILPEPKMRRQMWAYFSAFPPLAGALLWPPLIYPGAVLFGLSMALLGANLWSAFLVYRKNIKLVS
jgi:hypothetical protein